MYPQGYLQDKLFYLNTITKCKSNSLESFNYMILNRKINFFCQSRLALIFVCYKQGFLDHFVCTQKNYHVLKLKSLTWIVLSGAKIYTCFPYISLKILISKSNIWHILRFRYLITSKEIWFYYFPSFISNIVQIQVLTRR